MKKKKKQFEDYFQEATDVSGEQEQVVGKTFEEYLGIVDERLVTRGEHDLEREGAKVREEGGYRTSDASSKGEEEGEKKTGGNFKVNKQSGKLLETLVRDRLSELKSLAVGLATTIGKNKFKRTDGNTIQMNGDVLYHLPFEPTKPL